MAKRNAVIATSYFTLDPALDSLDRAMETSSIDEIHKLVDSARESLSALKNLRNEAVRENECSSHPASIAE